MEKNSRITRRHNIISNSSIEIPAQTCIFCNKEKRGGAVRYYKIAWKLIWHMSHHHKDEVGFEHELRRLKQLAIENSGTNKLEDLKIVK